MDRTVMPPHNIPAEESVLGSLLIDGPAFLKIANLVSEADFYSERNSLVFQSCRNLYDKGTMINQITAGAELARLGKVEAIGGLAYLGYLIANCPQSLDIEDYAKEVNARATDRRLIQIADQIAGLGYRRDGDGVNKAQRLIDALRRGEKHKKSPIITNKEASETLVTMVNEYQDTERVPLRYGWVALDDITGGLFPEYVIIGARPSVGKTQLMYELVIHLVEHGKRGLFVSLEMTVPEILEREIAMKTGISVGDLRGKKLSPDEWGKIMDLSGAIGERPLEYITDDLTSEQIMDWARRYHEEKPLDFLAVDYIQLLRDCRGVKDMHLAISNASKTFKTLRKELNIPVIVASQLNRGLEGRADKHPLLSDLKESGSLEEDADVVFLLYREELYEVTSENKGVLEVLMSKNRQQGMKPAVKLHWQEKEHCYR